MPMGSGTDAGTPPARVAVCETWIELPTTVPTAEVIWMVVMRGLLLLKSVPPWISKSSVPATNFVVAHVVSIADVGAGVTPGNVRKRVVLVVSTTAVPAELELGCAGGIVSSAVITFKRSKQVV